MATGYNLSDILISALRRHERVSIKGIGTLRLIPVKRTLPNETGTLLAPSHSIVLDDASTDAVDLSDFIISQSYISSKKAQKINNQLSELINSFVNYGAVDVENVGRFVLEEGMTQFSPEGPLVDPFLEGIDIVPHKVEVLSDAAESRVDKSELLTKGMAEDDVLTTTPKASRHSYSRYGDDDSGKKYLFLWLAGAAILTLLLYYMISSLLGGGDNSKRDVANDEVAAVVSDTLITLSTNERFADILTPDVLKAGCVVVTGTYGQSDNAQREASRIESLGYSSYLENHDNLIRVGVLFDCREHDLDDMLGRIRVDLAEKAWYLRPAYDPDNQ